MLTVKNQPPSPVDDDRDYLDPKLRAALLDLLQSSLEWRRNPRNDPDYHMPVLLKSGISDNQQEDVLTFDLKFSKYGKQYTFDFKLPVFTGLAPKVLRKETVEYGDEEPFDFEFPKKAAAVFPEFMFHPITKLFLGILSLANFSGMFFPNFVRAIIPSMIINASFAVKLSALCFSALYFIPVAAFYFKRDYFENKMHAYLADVENDINNGKCAEALKKLEWSNMPFMVDVLFDGNYASNRYWHWKTNYLRACAKDTNASYYRALHFSDNSHQKILSLKGILDDIDSGLPCDLSRIYNDPVKSIKTKKQECKEARERTKQRRAQYIAQIPTDDPLYHELGAKARAELGACLNTLRQGQVAVAMEQFNALKVDGYVAHAYPDVAIAYYQLDSIFVSLNQKRSWAKKPLDTFDCMDVVLENAEKIQSIIDNYYPERSAQYREYMDVYKNTRQTMYDAEEIIPELEVTELPELITPLAQVLRQREREQTNDPRDDADATADNSQKRRAPSF